MKWEIKKFDDLNAKAIHDLYQLRSQVFVVEQSCVYLDQDGKDLDAQHVLAYNEENKLVAYGRIMFPKHANEAIHFGRIVVHPDFRGQGLAKELVHRILKCIDSDYNHHKKSVEISAQYYLVDFYKKFNLNLSGEKYDEDGIPHIKMIREPKGNVYSLRSSSPHLLSVNINSKYAHSSLNVNNSKRVKI